MALLNFDLGSSETVISDQNADNGDIIDLRLLGSGTLVVDGVDVSINKLVGVGAIGSPSFAAQNGGSLTIKQGLLGLDVLTSTKFEIRDSGTITLDASAIKVGLLDTLLNRFELDYSGDYDTGTFVYKPPGLSLLALRPQTFTVSGMGATDVFEIEGRTNFELKSVGLGRAVTPDSAYRDGVLHLTSPGSPLLGETVDVEVPMTQAEFELFKADPGRYLDGTSFTFPGTLAVPCFAKGSMIRTDFGMVAIEKLAVGDMILTRDNGFQPIQWLGSRRLSAVQLAECPQFRPIRINAGALGAGCPQSDLLVSPQHRVLVRSAIAQRMFGCAEVLVAAKQLVGIAGIEIAQELEHVEYFHMLFDRHEIVYANGAETESLYTGAMGLKAVGKAAAEEIFALFPQLRSADFTATPARPLVPGRVGRKMAERHRNNDCALVSAL